MKKYIIHFLILLTLCLFSSISYTQEYSIKTGIVDFYAQDKKANESQIIVSGLSSVLGRYKFISLIERSKLSSLIKEIELSQTGLIDEATAVKAGKLHGIQLIIDGSISKTGIAARAIHTETGKIIATATAADKNDTEILAKKLAAGIEVYLAKENLKRLRNDTPGIDLEFWIEKKVGNITKIASINQRGKIKIGNSISFHFKSNNDGYITIVDIQPGGDVVLLYPNDYSKSNAVKAGVEYSIPSKDMEFEITTTEPAGQDTVIIFFTKKKVDWLDRNLLTGEGFKSVQEGEKIAATRGINVSATKLKSTEWKSAVIKIDVEK